MKKRNSRILAGAVAAVIAAAAITGCAKKTDTPAESTPAGGTEVQKTTPAPAGEKELSSNEVSGENAQKDMTGADIIGDLSLVKEGYIEPRIMMICSEAYDSLYPWGSTAGMECLAEMYEKLFGQLRGVEDMIPILADKNRGEFGGYDHQEGTSDYTVYIYDYIHDHEGNPVTAEDVVFSYEMNDAEGSVGALFKGVEAVDDTTVLFHFERELDGVGELENILTQTSITSKAAYEASTSGLVSDVCGTGPYVLKEYVSGAGCTIKRNEDYWQTNDELRPMMAEANVEEIEYKYIAENAQKVMALQTNAVDIAPSLNVTDTESFRDGGEYADQYNVYSWMQTGAKLLIPNCKEGRPCSDVNLRKAIFYAIDVNGIAASLGEGNAVANYALVPPIYENYCQEWEQLENYSTVTDPELAKEYLEKSSYNGETLVMITEATYTRECEVILNMLAQIGITMEIQTLDKSTLTAARTNGDWDLNIDQKAGSYLGKFINGAWSTSNTSHGMTINFVDDPEWQGMLEFLTSKAGNTRENLEEWQQRAYDNAYGMNLYSSNNFNVMNKGILTNVMNAQNRVLPGAMKYAAD